jgi:hypothetical protein
MRAPDEKFGGYTDAQWKAIGIDASIMIPLMTGYKQPIREYLDELGVTYLRLPEHRRRQPPPWQRTQRRRELRATLAAARAALDDHDLGLGPAALFARDEARAALDLVIANIPNMAIPRSRTNAEKVHIEYWRELALVYKLKQPRHSAKDLIAFVHACSRPVFPRETTLEAVTSFAYRFCKRARV